MVGRAVPASRPPHQRKLRLQNSRYTSFGGIISGRKSVRQNFGEAFSDGGSPAKILGKLFPTAEAPPKFWGSFFRRKKSHRNFGEAFSDGKSPTEISVGPFFGAETPFLCSFNRYSAEPAPVPALRDVFRPARRHWFLSDICCLLLGLVFGLFMACRIYCPCRTCRTCSCARAT